ncbi:MAG: DUF885 domain-containing protein [Carbonactinosporaceae bacterium]
MIPDEAFEQLATAALDDVLAAHPEQATLLGDHRHDDRLDDLRPEALEEERRLLGARLRQLSGLDTAALSTVNRVDAEILRARLEERLFAIEQLREPDWNPLLANPGSAIYGLLARDFAPLQDRLRSAARRLAAVPEHLAQARRTLGRMPRVHVETAIAQLGGTVSLLSAEVDRALAQAPAAAREIEAVRPAALDALDEHRRWLGDRLEDADGEPRIGPERFAAKLAGTLDAASGAEAILTRAEEDLVRVEEGIAQTASRIAGEAAGTPGLVRRVLDRLAEDSPGNDTIVGLARRALEQSTTFVRDRDLVTVYDDAVEIIEMPEIHRGVAIAYCDPPGPLETADLPTFFAISPTPDDWSADRVRSFFREYNAHMVHNLTVHEAMPGHVLQLGHARRFSPPTGVRAAFWSGPFVEGWAVYAEALMADGGYGGPAVRMQQLKMQLRMIINAILDVRVHAHGMTEREALRLMVERGHQEEGEAVGKWRRALLTSTQLSTYYVGYTEVRDVVAELRAARPDLAERALHDAVLAHGSPPPRHLRTLLGSPARR